MALVILVGLGLIAALAAALLVKVLVVPAKSQAGPKTVAEGEVLVAARALPAMTVVNSTAVLTKKVPLSAVPPGSLADPVQVVGKVLTVPMVEGEAFASANFARQGSGVHLAAALPAGKRAVSVSLNDYTGMVGLLYPGSVVDVMVSVQTTQGRGGAAGETYTRTLLQNVQVLAVGTESVTEGRGERGKDEAASKTINSVIQGDLRLVTLLVEPKQAQALQLAMQKGTLSLALRNPMDQKPVEQETTRVADLAGSRIGSNASSDVASSIFGRPLSGWLSKLQEPAASEPDAVQASAAVPAKKQPGKPAPKAWETVIIRGTASEVRSFPMPEKKPPESSDAAVSARN